MITLILRYKSAWNELRYSAAWLLLPCNWHLKNVGSLQQWASDIIIATTFMR